MTDECSIVLPSKLLAQVQRFARAHGTSPSDLIKEYLEGVVRFGSSRYDSLGAFSDGRLTRAEAMRFTSSRDYAELLDKLDGQLTPLPWSNPSEISREAETFAEIFCKGRFYSALVMDLAVLENLRRAAHLSLLIKAAPRTVLRDEDVGSLKAGQRASLSIAAFIMDNCPPFEILQTRADTEGTRHALPQRSDSHVEFESDYFGHETLHRSLDGTFAHGEPLIILSDLPQPELLSRYKSSTVVSTAGFIKGLEMAGEIESSRAIIFAINRGNIEAWYPKT